MNIFSILSISAILGLILLSNVNCSCDVEGTNSVSKITCVSTDVYVFSELIRNGYIPHFAADNYFKSTELDLIPLSDVRKHLKAWQARLRDSPIVKELFRDIIFSFLSRNDLWDSSGPFPIPWHFLLPWIKLLVLQNVERSTKLKEFEQRVDALSTIVRVSIQLDHSDRSKAGKPKVDILEFIASNPEGKKLGIERYILSLAEDYAKNTDYDLISKGLETAIEALTANLNDYIYKVCCLGYETRKLKISCDDSGHVTVYNSQFIFKGLSNLNLRIIYDSNLLRLLISKDDLRQMSIKSRSTNHPINRSSIGIALCNLSKLSMKPSVQIISIGFFTITVAANIINYLSIVDSHQTIFMIPSLYAVVAIRLTAIHHIRSCKDPLPDLLLQMIPYLPFAKYMISKAFVFFNTLSLFAMISHLFCIVTSKCDISNISDNVMLMSIGSFIIKILCDYASIFIITLLLYIMPLLNLLLSIYWYKISLH